MTTTAWIWSLPQEVITEKVFCYLNLKGLVLFHSAASATEKDRKQLQALFERAPHLSQEIVLVDECAQWMDEHCLWASAIALTRGVTQKSMPYLLKAITKCERLRIGLFPSDRALELLSQSCMKNSAIKSLWLFCSISSDSQYARAISNLKSLQVLRFGMDSPGGTAGMLKIAQQCTRLSEFYTDDGRPINDDVISAFAMNCKDLKKLVLRSAQRVTDAAMVSLATYSKHLQTLRLLGLKTAATDQGLALLCQGCPELSVLCLAGFRLTAPGVSAVAQHCGTRLTELETIHLDSAAWSTLPEVGVACVSRLQKLVTHWRHWQLLGDQAVHLTTLRSLRIDLPSEIAESTLLLHAKGRYQHLTCLSMDLHDSVQESTVQAFLSQVPSLTDLTLRTCTSVTDSIVCDLARRCPRLTKLSLHGAGHLSDASLLSLSQRCTGLEVLDLPHCPNFTDDGVLALLQACGRLAALSLTSSERITDAVVLALAQHCPRLRELNVADCPLISAGALQELGARCRKLERLKVYRDCISPDVARRIEEGHKVRRLVVSRERHR